MAVIATLVADRQWDSAHTHTHKHIHARAKNLCCRQTQRAELLPTSVIADALCMTGEKRRKTMEMERATLRWDPNKLHVISVTLIFRLPSPTHWKLHSDNRWCLCTLQDTKNNTVSAWSLRVAISNLSFSYSYLFMKCSSCLRVYDQFSSRVASSCNQLGYFRS